MGAPNLLAHGEYAEDALFRDAKRNREANAPRTVARTIARAHRRAAHQVCGVFAEQFR
jgi:hypothetical protein